MGPSLALAFALSRVIYLDRDGATLRPGPNDSRAGTSTIVPHEVHVPAWDVAPDDWATTVACVREIWAPFDVTITDVDPGEVPHIEVVLGGAPADIGMVMNVGGVSPFRADCSVIENSIVFAFPGLLHDHPRVVCEVASQEIGHSFGLDHELDAADPMSYLTFHGARAFQDQDVACGEYTPRPCGLTTPSCRPNQNSVQLLLTRLGPAFDVAHELAIGEARVDDTPPLDPSLGEPAGCSVGGGSAGNLVVALGLLRRARGRRSRSRRPGSAGSAPGARGSCASSSRPSSS